MAETGFAIDPTPLPKTPSTLDCRGGFSYGPAVFYIVAVLIFMATAAWLVWPLPERAFMSDRTAISWLSSAQLWAMAVLALRLTSERTLPARLGWWLSLSMTVLACDEQFMLHEQWKYGCIDWLPACRYWAVTELPMLSVGVFGAASIVWFARAIESRAARMMLLASLLVGVFALWLDLFAASGPLSPYEEGFECLAEALFVGVFLGLRHTGERQ